MKPLISLIVCTLALTAADAPKVIFSKTFIGSAPPFFIIAVDQKGAGTYNESTDPDNAEKLTIEPAVVRQIFDAAERLDHFKQPLESGLKVANMGLKTLRWESDALQQEAKFNYSTTEDAKTLSDIFERIAESTRMLVDLNRAIKHDRLGVNDATLRIQTAWDSKRLVATAQFLPLLERVASNESYIHMARERAARIVDAIRAANP